MAWIAIGGAAAFLVVALVFASRFGTDPALTASPLIGEPAPTEAIPLQDGSGEVSVADFEGSVIVVNFWASWCLGCRTEHPALLQAADGYEDFGVQFIAVNYQDDRANALRFLEELGTGDSTIYAVDEGSATAFEWGVLGLPETFFVDQTGTVVGKVSGPVSYGLLTQTLDQIILGETVGEVTTGEVENR
jgi:cytochrome c biogenesis protein CcmG/thiol:disulfide interchange protein DsbE